MRKWKITYSSDSTPDEEVTAVDYHLGDVWTEFSDGGGVITSIRTSLIHRIDRAQN